jgi:hypothetical protein
LKEGQARVAGRGTRAQQFGEKTGDVIRHRF